MSIPDDSDRADDTWPDPAEQLIPAISDKVLHDLPFVAPLADFYDFEGILGEGGMAVVVLAKEKNTFLRRKVALKFPQDQLANNPDAVKRFQREAEAATRVTHDNVVQVYGGKLIPEDKTLKGSGSVGAVKTS